jgi:hypothetical protein
VLLGVFLACEECKSLKEMEELMGTYDLPNACQTWLQELSIADLYRLQKDHLQ